MIKTSVTGFVKQIQEQKTFSDNFSKKTLILETLNEYNPIVAIDFVNARMDTLNGIKTGMSVEVWVDIYSRQSTKDENQYFTNVTGWRIKQNDGDGNETDQIEESEFKSDSLPF